jgi:hypothetical protein
MWVWKVPVVEFVLTDRSGSTAFCRFNLPIGTSETVAHAEASALRTRLLAITGCAISRQSIIYTAVPISQYAPAAGSDATSIGLFIWGTAMPDVFGSTSVPGLLSSKLVAPPDPLADVAIDTNDTDIAAFITAILDGIYTNQFGDDLTTLEAAYLQMQG